MPGLNFIFSEENTYFSNDLEISTNENLQTEKISDSENHLLTFTSYLGYPSTKINAGEDVSIFIEGEIYNRTSTQIEQTLSKITNQFSKTKDFGELQNWVKSCDGEFCVFVYFNKSGEILLFNDSLARLPIYFYRSEKKMIFSRSLKFVIENSKIDTYNDLSIAQFLLFGYVLDDKTLFNEIFHLNPSTIFYINSKGKIISETDNFLVNFEEKEHIDSRQQLQTVTDLFIKGCKNRSQKNNNILSLSGGLDSRIVAGGLFQANTSFSSTTLLDPWKVNNKEGNLEVDLAKEISDILGTGIKTIEGSLATGNDFLRMLKIKDGTNHLGFSYLLKYLDEVIKNFSSEIRFFTGDGGDKVIKYQLPSMNIKNYEQLLDYIVKVHKRFDLKNVARITHVKESDLRESIINRLKSYPEKDFNFKYVRFVFQERVKNWLFEGEDRNRNYFWSVTPFYSSEFFIASMRMPDAQKKRNKLYINMLNILNPKLNNVIYANLNWPVNSIKSKIYLILKDYYNHLPSNYRSKLRKVAKKETIVSDNDNITLKLLKEQVKNSLEFFTKYLNVEEISKFEKLNSDELKMMFNLTSTMEYHSLDKSVISKFLDHPFPFK